MNTNTATRPRIPPPLKSEIERDEFARLSKIAEPLMDAIPSSLEYRLEHILLQASTIYADRLTRSVA